MTSLQDLIELKKQFEDQARSAGKEAIKLELKIFFDQNPSVLGVRWAQYTPYFMDGDPCEFSVHEPCIRLENTGPEEGEQEDGYLGTYDLKNKELKTALNNLYKNLSDAEDVLLFAFGDHAEITVTRDGLVEVDGYEHH